MKRYAIILAADLPSSSEVVSAIRKAAGAIDGVKIGVATLLEAGAQVVSRVRDLIGEKPILVDLKIADIGFAARGRWDGTNSKIIGSLARSGATHVTVHGFPGPFSVAEAAAAAEDAGIGALLLPLMSHEGGGLFFSASVDIALVREEIARAGGTTPASCSGQLRDVTDAILLVGEAFGVYGYIGPATRPADLERYRSLTKKPIWCPGFGRQDRLERSLEEQLLDWGKIVGPESAAIVGSAIFAADDPERAAREIADIRDRAAQQLNCRRQ
jgi:orotidine-5'-phosphate decarboxylase